MVRRNGNQSEGVGGDEIDSSDEGQWTTNFRNSDSVCKARFGLAVGNEKGV